MREGDGPEYSPGLATLPPLPFASPAKKNKKKNALQILLALAALLSK